MGGTGPVVPPPAATPTTGLPAAAPLVAIPPAMLCSVPPRPPGVLGRDVARTVPLNCGGGATSMPMLAAAAAAVGGGLGGGDCSAGGMGTVPLPRSPPHVGVPPGRGARRTASAMVVGGRYMCSSE
jgi:hypothetical protein